MENLPPHLRAKAQEGGEAVSQRQDIIEAFQVHGNEMTLRQMFNYSWSWEFRSRASEINNDPNEPYAIRLVKRGEKKSDNLYTLEKKVPGGLF